MDGGGREGRGLAGARGVMEGCGAAVEGWGSSGGGGEQCSRRGGDERGCICQSLIPPFGK